MIPISREIPTFVIIVDMQRLFHPACSSLLKAPSDEKLRASNRLSTAPLLAHVLALVGSSSGQWILQLNK